MHMMKFIGQEVTLPTHENPQFIHYLDGTNGMDGLK